MKSRKIKYEEEVRSPILTGMENIMENAACA